MKSHTTLSLLATVLLSIAPQIHADTDSRDKTTAQEVQQKATETTGAIKNYTATCTDRTFVWPSEEILKGVITNCLSKIAVSLQNDTSLAGFLAGK